MTFEEQSKYINSLNLDFGTHKFIELMSKSF